MRVMGAEESELLRKLLTKRRAGLALTTEAFLLFLCALMASKNDVLAGLELLEGVLLGLDTSLPTVLVFFALVSRNC